MKALDKKFEKRREELGKKMMTAMMQAGTSGSEALAEAMKNIGSSMGKLR